MFMINHNLDVKLIPLRPREPGWWDDLTSKVGGAISIAKDTVSSAISQGQDTISSILVPDFIHTPGTNAVPSVLADSNGCAPFSGGKATNFVMLDFVDIGEGMKAVDVLNGFE